MVPLGSEVVVGIGKNESVIRVPDGSKLEEREELPVLSGPMVEEEL